MSRKSIKNKRGFTLLEVVVTLAVFAVTIVMAVDLFLTISGIQRRVTVRQMVESNAQLFLEKGADHIPTETQIDYEFYQDMGIALDEEGNNPTHILAMKSVLMPKFQIVIRQSGSESDPWDGTGDDLEFCDTDMFGIGIPAQESCQDREPEDWETYSFADTKVENIEFYISPSLSHLTRDAGEFLSNQQEMVTVLISVIGPGARPNETIEVDLQSTYSLNLYKR